MKDIVLIGGPNGEGKTTAARVLPPPSFHLHEFISADEMARESSPKILIAALDAGMAEVSQRLKSGEMDESGRYFHRR